MAGLFDATRGTIAAAPNDLFTRTGSAPVRGEPSAEEMAAADKDFYGDFTGGAVSALRGTVGSTKAYIAAALAAAGHKDAAKALYDSAAEDADVARNVAPEIGSASQVNSLGTGARYALGKAGSMVPMLPVAGAGGLLGRAVLGDEAGALTGSMAAFHPSMAGEHIEALRANPNTANMSPGEMFARGNAVALPQDVAMGIVPGKMTNALFKPGAISSTMRGRASDVVTGALKNSGTMGAGMAGSDVIGQAGMMSADPTVQYNPTQTIDAGIGGAVGMLPVAVPHAVAEHAIGAGGQLVDGAGNVRDAAGRLIKSAADKGKEAVAGASMPGAEVLGNAVGKAVSGAKQGTANLLDRITNGQRDPDVAALLTSPKLNGDAGDVDLLRASDAKRNQHAESVAQKTISDPDAPEHLRAAAEDFLAGNKTGDAWAPLMHAVRSHEQEQSFGDAADRFVSSLRDAGVSVGKSASDFKAGYKNGRKENAQAVDDPFTKLLARALFEHTRVTDDESIGRTFGRMEEAATGLQDWIKNGYAVEPGGEVVVPDGLQELFTDPAKAINTAHKLMKQQGLLDAKADKALPKVLTELTAHTKAREDSRDLIASNLLPTAREEFGIKPDDKRAHQDIADEVKRMITSGKFDDASLDKLFGPNKEKVLDALSGAVKLNKGEKQASEQRTELSDEFAADDADAATDDTLAGQTDAMHPNEFSRRATWHGNYDTSKEGNTKGMEAAIAGMKANGKRAEAVGLIDHYREIYKDRPEDFADAVMAAIKHHDERLTGAERDRPDEAINERFKIIRAEDGSDKADPTTIHGDEFHVVSGKGLANKWALVPGKNNEWADVTKGRLFFERVNQKESLDTNTGEITKVAAEPTEFNTSADKIISRMRRARADSSSESGRGVADQHDMLLQGISSFLSAKNDDGSYALTGRVGISRNGKMEWLSQARGTRPEAADPLTREGRIAAAKAEGDTYRNASGNRAKAGPTNFITLPDDFRFSNGKTAKDARDYSATETRKERAAEMRVLKIDGAQQIFESRGAAEEAAKGKPALLVAEHGSKEWALYEKRPEGSYRVSTDGSGEPLTFNTRKEAEAAVTDKFGASSQFVAPHGVDGFAVYEPKVPTPTRIVATRADGKGAWFGTKDAANAWINAQEKGSYEAEQLGKNGKWAATELDRGARDIEWERSLNNENKKIEGKFNKVADKASAPEYNLVTPKEKAVHMAALKNKDTELGKEYAALKDKLAELQGRARELTTRIELAQKYADAAKFPAVRVKRQAFVADLQEKLTSIDTTVQTSSKMVTDADGKKRTEVVPGKESQIAKVESQIARMEQITGRSEVQYRGKDGTVTAKPVRGDVRSERWKNSSASEGEEMAQFGIERAKDEERNFQEETGAPLHERTSTRVRPVTEGNIAIRGGWEEPSAQVNARGEMTPAERLVAERTAAASKAKPGEAKGMKSVEQSKAAAIAAREAVLDVPKAPTEKQVAWTLDILRKGIPAFSDGIKALSAERKAGIKDTIEQMLRAKKQDDAIWNGKPPADMEAFAKRAKVALERLGDAAPKVDTKVEAAKPDAAVFERALTKEDYSFIEAPKDALDFASWARDEFKHLDAIEDDFATDRDAEVHQYIWGLRDEAKQYLAGKTSTDFASFFDGMNGDHDALGRQMAETLLGRKPTDPTPPKGGMENAQKPNGDMSADTAAAVTDTIHKLVGKDVTVEISKALTGKSGARISGDWTKGAIRVAMNAHDPLGVAFHESMHEFFQRMVDSGHEKSVKVLTDMVSSEHVQRRLDLAFADDKAVLAAMKADPSERVAYAFQLWAAGKLKLGPNSHTMFNKVADIIRRVFGLLSNDQKAHDLMTQFASGRMSERGAMAKLLNTNEAKGEYARTIAKKINPILNRGSEYVGFAENQLTGSDNKALDGIGRMFHNKTGGRGDEQGFLSAKEQMHAQFDNKFAAALHGRSPEEIAAGLEGLQTKKWHADPVVNKMQHDIANVFKEMYAYGAEVGLERLDAESGKWVKMGKQDDYRLPVSWDASKLVSHADEFKADMLKYHSDALQAIADQANKEVAADTHAGKYTASWEKLNNSDTTPVTKENVLDAIHNRMIRTNGQTDIKESQNELGFSPHMRAINSRTLHFINQEHFAKYQEKDMAKILTTYVSQMTSRTEYARRFGNDGKLMQQKMDEAFGFERDRALKENPKLTGGEADVVALKKLAPAQRAIMAMEGTLGHDISPLLRKVNAYSIIYQNLRLLGYPLFSSFIDPLGIMVNGGEMKDAYATMKRGLSEVAKEWGKLTGLREEKASDRDEATRVAEMIGTIDSGMFMSTLGMTYGSQFLGQTARGFNDKFFRWNGMEPFTRAMRIGATQAAISFIKRHYEAPNEHSARYFEELGLDRKNVQITKEGGLNVDNRNVQQAVMRWVDGAILRPNAAIRPTMSSDPHYAVFYHLKQFMYATQSVITKRMMVEAKNGNTNPAVLAFAGYIPTMLMADAAKGILQGTMGAQTPVWEHEGVGGVLGHGLNRTGLIGPSQMALDIPEYGPASLLGPTAEQVVSATHQPLRDTVHSALAVGPLNFAMAGNAAND